MGDEGIESSDKRGVSWLHERTFHLNKSNRHRVVTLGLEEVLVSPETDNRIQSSQKATSNSQQGGD